MSLITQSERLRNEETQQHRDIENRSTNMIENQFLKQQEKFTQIEKPHISTNSNENLPKWSRNITLTVGDSICLALRKEEFQELPSMTCTII